MLLPSPVGPTINVWPTSRVWRFSRKGVAPFVLAKSSGGEPFGKKGQGHSGSPGHSVVSGRRSATQKELTIGRRTLALETPGRLPGKPRPRRWFPGAPKTPVGERLEHLARPARHLFRGWETPAPRPTSGSRRPPHPTRSRPRPRPPRPPSPRHAGSQTLSPVPSRRAGSRPRARPRTTAAASGGSGRPLRRRQRNEPRRVPEGKGELSQDRELPGPRRGRQTLDRDHGEVHPADPRLPAADKVLGAQNRIEQNSRLEVRCPPPAEPRRALP